MKIFTLPTRVTFSCQISTRNESLHLKRKNQADFLEILSDRNDIKNSFLCFNGLKIFEDNEKSLSLSLSFPLFMIERDRIVALSVHSQRLFDCDFDDRQRCLEGFLSGSFVLLDESSEEPQQPASGVSVTGKEHFSSSPSFFSIR